VRSLDRNNLVVRRRRARMVERRRIQPRPGLLLKTRLAPPVVHRNSALPRAWAQTRSIQISMDVVHGSRRLPLRHVEGIAAYCDPPVRFGVVESINTTIKSGAPSRERDAS
jgi:hypothetical protein